MVEAEEDNKVIENLMTGYFLYSNDKTTGTRCMFQKQNFKTKHIYEEFKTIK